jgi:hypothetical protein
MNQSVPTTNLPSVVGLVLVLGLATGLDRLLLFLNDLTPGGDPQSGYLNVVLSVLLSLLFLASLVLFLSVVIGSSNGHPGISWLCILLGGLLVMWPVGLRGPLAGVIPSGTIFRPSSFFFLASGFVLLTGIANLINTHRKIFTKRARE